MAVNDHKDEQVSSVENPGDSDSQPKGDRRSNPLNEFARGFVRFLFARTEGDVSRVNDETLLKKTGFGWLWSQLLQARPVYRQALVLSFFVNLFFSELCRDLSPEHVELS